MTLFVNHPILLWILLVVLALVAVSWLIEKLSDWRKSREPVFQVQDFAELVQELNDEKSMREQQEDDRLRQIWENAR